MRYKLLGRSGLRVSELCLGTMTFGEDWGWGASKDESRRIYDIFRESGGNFIDTADLYTNGTSERFLGEFMEAHRDSVVLATKFSNAAPGKDPNAGGNQRNNLMRAVDASLKRLRTDYVDLYWLHNWDQLTPAEEIMRGFDDLVRAGKVLYVGISDAPAWWVSRANALAEFRGCTPFVGLQIEWSLIERTVERELVPMAQALGLAITPWGPIGAGVLTGKYTNRDGTPKKSTGEGARYENSMMAEWANLDERKHRIAKTVMDIAAESNHSAAQVAINWLRQRSVAGSPVIPIIGARKASQVQDNLKCVDWTLSDEQLHRLEEVSRISMGFPHDFFAMNMVRTFAYGGTRDLIDA
jgi:aryl-alcohol dehydrogenase-like predicted oxidoreductase